MARKKILNIVSWFPSYENPTRGIFIKEHIKSVQIYNDVVTIFCEQSRCLKNNIVKIDDKNENGMRLLHMKLNCTIPILAKIKFVIFSWFIFKSFHKLKNDEWCPDIIHIHLYTIGIPAIILSKMHKIPAVVTEHWSGFPNKKLRFFDIIKAKFVMNNADVILPVSKNLENSIKVYGIKNKFEILPNVVDTKIFYPSKIAKNRNPKRILFVALLTPIKGVEYLLQALVELKRERKDFILDIIGDGPNKKQYEKLMYDLGLNDIVRFHGWKPKEEIAKIMRESNFFVLPSIWENLPCVLIEAMASGLPIVASNVGGIPEIITKEVGILVPPRNIRELMKSINCMLDSYQNYSPNKISHLAKIRFSTQTVSKKIDEIYKEVINGT